MCLRVAPQRADKTSRDTQDLLGCGEKRPARSRSHPYRLPSAQRKAEQVVCGESRYQWGKGSHSALPHSGAEQRWLLPSGGGFADRPPPSDSCAAGGHGMSNQR